MFRPLIPYMRWELVPEEPNDYSAHFLRGAIAARYRDWWVFHQHFGKQNIYRHPLVQYKCIDGILMVVGLSMGAELLEALEPPNELILNGILVKFREVRKVV
ncbi:MAG: hypothetical protein D6748_05645, partial [Calditrichaeota bacterium]